MAETLLNVNISATDGGLESYSEIRQIWRALRLWRLNKPNMAVYDILATAERYPAARQPDRKLSSDHSDLATHTVTIWGPYIDPFAEPDDDRESALWHVRDTVKVRHVTSIEIATEAHGVTRHRGEQRRDLWIEF